MLRATFNHVEKGQDGPLGSGLKDRLGSEPYAGWIWDEERTDDIFTRSFRHLVLDNYGERLVTVTPDEVAMLARGARLLNELLPQSSRSALTHVQLIAVFPPIGAWTKRASSSQIRLSGTIFLSRKRLSSPLWVAEHMFHEALHQQLYDFRQAHSLLRPDFGEDEAQEFVHFGSTGR